MLILFFSFTFYSNTYGQETTDKIYLYFEVDELPIFGTSNDQLFSFIYNNLTWPKMFDGEGEVIISFIVDVEGKITKLNIVKSLCSECDEQVKEIFQNMPTWKPGMKNGNQVNVKMYVPVRFILR